MAGKPTFTMTDVDGKRFVEFATEDLTDEDDGPEEFLVFRVQLEVELADLMPTIKRRAVQRAEQMLKSIEASL